MIRFRDRGVGVSLLASVLLAGCPQSGPASLKREAAGASSDAVAKAAAGVADRAAANAGGTSGAMMSGGVSAAVSAQSAAGQAAPPINFSLDWGDTGRKVQIVPSQIAGNTFVTLMNAQTGVAIGGSLTDSSGNFSLNFGGGFVPDPTKLYILEAHKGLGPQTGTDAQNNPIFNFNQAKYPAVRLRTIMKWEGQWRSLSSGGITLNRGTTALSILYSLRLGTAKRLNELLLMDAIQPKTDETCDAAVKDRYVGTDGNVSKCPTAGNNWNTVWKMVDEALTYNQDPVASVAMSTSNLDQFIPIVTPPSITAISATSGNTNPGATQITIDGGPFRGNNQTLVYLNGLPITTTWVNQTQVRATITNGCSQAGANCTSQQNGLVPTTGPLAVGMSGAISLSNSNFTVLPRFSNISAGSGVTGLNFAINGNGFDPAHTTVNFVGAGGSPNVVASSAVSKDGTVISVTVPAAACTGPIVVSGPGGNFSTSTFTVDPVITGTSAQEGRAGTTITVTGSGFGPSAGLVEFGGAGFNGNINSWNPNSISVSVPGNAGTGNVHVQTNAGRRSPAGPRFKVQFTISNWSYSSSWSPTTLTVDGAGFGSGPNNDNRLEGVDGGAKIRIKSWTGTRIVAAAYGLPGYRATYRLVTSGGPASGVTPTSQRDFVWNGALSRRVVDGLGNLWFHDRSSNIWRVPVNTSGNSLRGTKSEGRFIPTNCRITNLVLDSFDNLYVTDHCGRVRKWGFDQNMNSPSLIWERGGFPALQRIALDASNNVYVKQHGCKSCRRWARNYYVDTTRQDFWDIGVTNGRATSGGGTIVSIDNRYYTWNARQGRCQRIEQYWSGADNPGGSERMNRGRQWENYTLCGGPTRNPHRIPSGMGEDTSQRKWFLHVWGGVTRMNSGWGVDARWSGYRCSWHATVGTDLNGNVYMGNMGCHGGSGVIIFNGGPSTWVNNHNGGDIRF